jgi:RsiW-degrading membrane proteinase PrsW (M82 family)
MTGNATYHGFLRQRLTETQPAGDRPLLHPLSESHEMVIGRDPSCQIVLDSTTYGGVSRRHASIRPATTKVTQANDSLTVWQICDLNSANGTYINGQRLQGCRQLKAGDHIILGSSGPEFLFEYIPDSMLRPGSSFASQAEGVTITQLFPILSTGRDLRTKAYLLPATITVSFVVLLFIAIGNSLFFNLLLAAYLAGAAYFFVYQLCGKHKPWWWLGLTALATVVILLSPLLGLFITIFREIFPGRLPTEGETLHLGTLLVRMFFGAGLMEELLKALPVLIAALIGTQLRSPWRERLGVWEPLDGILLGTASAVGFTLVETLGQYVPGIMQDVVLTSGRDVAELVGLQLLIPRILGSVAGHLAYSGYFGYFIGLSVLKPKQRWLILSVGYLTAASLHALWNTTGSFNVLILAGAGILSYAFLAAAILKARTLSPNRSQNFATRLSGRL